ncbi:MAG: ribosome silencing factor [Pseudomonadota bacterium]
MVYFAYLKAAEKNAIDPVIIEISKLSSIADYFLIVSAESDRQAKAIADEIASGFKKEKKIMALSIEGLEGLNWVLLDYGQVIVHIFLPHIREYYNLEKLWADAPRLDIKSLSKELVVRKDMSIRNVSTP